MSIHCLRFDSHLVFPHAQFRMCALLHTSLIYCKRMQQSCRFSNLRLRSIPHGATSEDVQMRSDLDYFKPFTILVEMSQTPTTPSSPLGLPPAYAMYRGFPSNPGGSCRNTSGQPLRLGLEDIRSPVPDRCLVTTGNMDCYA
jgi:hypothetical protein